MVSSLENHESLVSRIAALHLAYEASKSKILWFGQLVAQHPGIKKSLSEAMRGKRHPEMVSLIVAFCIYTFLHIFHI